MAFLKLKNIILNGLFDKDRLMVNLDLFFIDGALTEDEYRELHELMSYV